MHTLFQKLGRQIFCGGNFNPVYPDPFGASYAYMQTFEVLATEVVFIIIFAKLNSNFNQL